MRTLYFLALVAFKRVILGLSVLARVIERNGV